MTRKTMFNYGIKLLAAMVVTGSVTTQATVHRVFEGESIQATIDVAAPGDTILVEPGEYVESASSRYGLRITTNNLRLIGKARNSHGHPGKVRLIFNDADDSMQETGVYAAPAGCEYDESLEECDEELHGFYIRGFSVEGFPVNGIQTRWVNDFKFVRNESVNNLNNGIYPTLSANGLVRNNVSYGSLDTAMWVAGSENVRVIGNDLSQSTIGFEITVSNDVLVKNNDIYNNTLGIGLFHPNAAGNGPLPVMENWVVKQNWVYNNNLPNPASPSTFQGALPSGGGILLLGISNHVIKKNKIDDNNFFGIGVLGWCTANSFDPNRNCEVRPPIADPSANNNRIVRNTLNNNGTNPPADFPLAPLASDVIYLQTPPFEPGTGNCFKNNRPHEAFTFFSSEPDGELPTDGC
ncbi:MAG: right-handed parallel beta-helix repeat-containing protein [Gammaproteobacteria bacterium]